MMVRLCYTKLIWINMKYQVVPKSSAGRTMINEREVANDAPPIGKNFYSYVDKEMRALSYLQVR